MRFVATILTILMCGVLAADLTSAEVTVNLQVAADGLTAPLNLVSPPTAPSGASSPSRSGSSRS